MRLLGLVLLSAVYGMAVAMPANAHGVLHRVEIGSGRGIINVDARCGQGYRWVPPGYSRKGKWRDGHCAPR